MGIGFGVIRMANVQEISVDSICQKAGLSSAHLERRKKYITASDLPAIANASRWKSRADVWAEKVGMVEGGKPAGLPAAIGNFCEPALRAMVEAALDVKLTRRGAWNVKGCMGATLDDVVEEDRSKIVQYKTGGDYAADEWEEGPPIQHIIQIHGEMICSGAETAYLAALLGGFGPLKFRLFRVDRDEQLCTDLEALANDFWHNYVLTGKQPEGEYANLETLKRIVRVPNKVVPISDEMVTRWMEHKQNRLDAEKIVKGIKTAEDAALAEILTTMGDAEGGQCNMGVLTYMETHRKGYTVEATSYRSVKFIDANKPTKKGNKKEVAAS
jgi:predicted phage-related endonuclease